jgi:GT2 family glycosyltransferase
MLFNIKTLLNNFIFKRNIKLECLVLKNITRCSNGYHWDSHTPEFNCTQLNPVPGFYMLEVTINGASNAFMTKLYVDYGEGFSEQNCIPLLVKSNECTKRLCFFKRRVVALKWAPSDQPGAMQSFELSLKRVTKGFAFKRITKKLILKNRYETSLKQFGKTNFITAYNQLFLQATLPAFNYSDWIKQVEPALWHSLDKLPNEDICFSIVVPTYNAKPEWLEACFNSVVSQTYINWQLIVVDDASTNQASINFLSSWKTRQSSNIEVVFEKENGHISAASNTGLARATGDYVLFLDHDDTLAPQALNELAISISENSNAQVLYSDEDLMTEAGVRVTPHFKSSWNPELLTAHNYVTHLCCYKRSLLKDLNGFRLGYEGAQDYDLILRASRMVQPVNIIHIPKVLYHWRMVEGSTAMSAGAKSYATIAGLKALQDHMQAIEPLAKVAHSTRENFYKVSWPLPKTLPKVSIIIPTRDGLEVLKPCIDGLLNNTDYSNLEIVILDNGSQQADTFAYFSQLKVYPFIKVVRDDGPFNYSAINNQAVRHSSGDLICLLNNDIEIIHADWLAEMVSLAIRPEVGCVGAKLLYPDETIQHAGVIMGLGGYAAHSHRGTGRHEPGYFCRAQLRQNLSAVTAACLLVRRDIYEQVSGLDEQFEVAYNDVDFCLRVQAAGFKNIYTPYAELYHHESRTRGSDTSGEKQKRFDKEKALLLSRWSSQIKNDPFYNPNLTRDSEDFAIGNTSDK